MQQFQEYFVSSMQRLHSRIIAATDAQQHADMEDDLEHDEHELDDVSCRMWRLSSEHYEADSGRTLDISLPRGEALLHVLDHHDDEPQ
ncbi:unnamed protein product, partial [Amoebophrya sp. A25]|eukprot:GSA25T00023769001.1